MSFEADKLYNLLPAVHRIRDAEQGYPLRDLIAVITDQAAVLEENLDQLYENHFVETAAPWVLPYIGDLLGIRGLGGSGKLIRSLRSEVGHTIAYRRRKGTAAMLEMLAHDVTGWPARAVEYFERLAVTQYQNHIRAGNRSFASLRHAGNLHLFGSPFEDATRTIEVRRIQIGRGKWNIPNVGIFLWRLGSYSLTRTQLVPCKALKVDDKLARRRFRLHPLGMDIQLFNRPETERDFTHLAEPVNVPMPLSCRRLRGSAFPASPGIPKKYSPWPNKFHPSEDYYGAGKSILLEYHKVSGPSGNRLHEFSEIRSDEIIVCDLCDVFDSSGKVFKWGHEEYAQKHRMILLDPARGRVIFPKNVPVRKEPVVTFHYGFSANLGGGEYDRSRSFSAKKIKTVHVAGADSSAFPAVSKALDALGTESGIVEIDDSRRYDDTELLTLDSTGRQIEIRVADQHRPTLLSPHQTLTVTGDSEASVTLNGLLLGGRKIETSGNPGYLSLRHCTLLPGLKIATDGSVSLDSSPAVVVNSHTTLEIDNSIIGPIIVGPDVQVHLRNCIVDAGSDDDAALEGVDSNVSGIWRIENCTIRGKVQARIMKLASNSIFLSSEIYVQRRQEGCVRFCFLPPDARVPRRYRCLPIEGSVTLQPQFTSLLFGDAAYFQLGRFCDEAIRRGADDESETGAFHDLFQHQREAHLRMRLEEYLRFGLEAGIFMAP